MKYTNLKRFLIYYAKEKRIIKVLILVMILASSLGMLLPYFFSRRIIEINNVAFNNVLTLAIIIIVIILLNHIFWYLWEKIASILSNKVANNIRIDMLKKLTNTNYFEIKNKSSGYYLERINDDVLEVSSFVGNLLGTIVDCLTNFSFLILIYILNYKCRLIFTIGIILSYLVENIKIKKDLVFTKKLKILTENFNSKVNETFKGIKEIKGLGIKDVIVDNSTSISKQLVDIQINKDKTFAFWGKIKNCIIHTIEAILVVYSVGILIPNGELSVVILLMIIDYSGFMYDLVGFIANMKDQFIKGEFKAGRILEILDNTKIDKFGTYNKKLSNFSIRINNLSYRYEDNKTCNILNNINLYIKENTASVFIGNSGSGKTTLFGLLTKLFECKDNTIFIGGKDINKLSQETLNKNMCVITQEPFFVK